MPKGVYNRKTAKQPPRRKMFLSKDELNQMYLKEKMGSVEIAEKLNCSAQTIMYWLKKHKIPMRSINEANKEQRKRLRSSKRQTVFKLTKDILYKEYVVSRKTPNQIASEYGCSWDVVRRNLLRCGFRLPQHTKGNGKRTSTEYRRFQKNALRKYGYKCAICGYDKFVNACHIKPRFQGGSDDISNAIVLCPNHHAEFDYGILKINKRKSDTPSNRR